MTSASLAPFIGRHHHELTHHLTARCGVPVPGTGTEPFAFVLEGETGVGKSRIVREVYERLRTSRGAADQPLYWPSLGADALTSGPPLAGAFPVASMPRKALAPPPQTMRWEAGSLPGFAWWSIRCEQRGSAGIAFHSAIQAQLDAHERPLSAARHLHSTPLEQARVAVAPLVDQVASMGASEAMDQAWSLIPIPGASMIVDAILSVGKAALNWRRQRRSITQLVDTGQEAEVAARNRTAEYSEAISHLACPQVPAVIVIEDAHLMDEAVLSFLDGLPTDPEHPVFVIATAWPSRHSPHYTRWLAGTPRLEVLPVQPPASAELAYLIGHATRFRVPEHTAADLAGVLATPLSVVTYLGLHAVHNIVWQEPIAPDATARLMRIAREDSRLEQLVDQRWRDLPWEVQHALAFGSLAADSGDNLAAFVPSIVLAAVESNFTPTPVNLRKLRDGFERALGLAWSQRLPEWDQFSEPTLAGAARRCAADSLRLPPGEDDRFRETIARASMERLAAPHGQARHAPEAARSLANAVERDHLARTREGAAAVLALATEALQATDIDSAVEWLILLTAQDAAPVVEVFIGQLLLCEILLDAADLTPFGPHFNRLSALYPQVAEGLSPDTRARARFAAMSFELDRSVQQFHVELGRSGITTNVAASAPYDRARAGFQQMIGAIRDFHPFPMDAEADLSIRFAIALDAANARVAAIELLLRVYGRVSDLAEPDGDTYLATASALLTIAGGHGSSTRLLPIAEQFSEAISRQHGRFSPDGVTASTMHSRWLLHSNAADRERGFELSKVNAPVARAEFGVGSPQSLAAHTVLFTCLRRLAADDRAKAASGAAELDEFCDAAQAAASGNPDALRYIAWMRANLALRSTGEEFERVVEQPLTIAATAPSTPGERANRVELASSLYSAFLSDLPLAASHNLKRQTKNKNDLALHAEEHGLDLFSL